MTITPLYKSLQKSQLKSFLQSLPTGLEIPPFSEWAEKNRYIPPGVTPYYGMHRKETAPHMVEILERLHPDDPCTWITVMKSVQSTATHHAECAVGAYIQYKLGSIGYFTSTKEQARIRSSSNIDVMIDNSGLKNLVRPHSTRNKRKQGDTALYKEFMGGIKLILNSYKSIAGMKSNTLPFLILDEIDEAPDELKDQGDILALLEGRTIAIRRPKILAISTPTRMENSKIYRLYKEGDQRKYYVPCPHCGEFQTLVLKPRGEKYGLTFDTEEVDSRRILIPETVRYTCKHCQEEIWESKKQQMLLQGKWVPTVTPASPLKHSYHINALYSPEMFLSWARICDQFCLSGFGEDPLRFKDFTINYLGNPWAATQKTMAWEALRDKAEDYTLGEVPQGALRLYAGVDVQGDRLEMAVWGIGTHMEKWLVDYQIFYGDPADLQSPCWKEVERQSHTPYFIQDIPCQIVRVAIDCGWDPKEKRDKDWGSKTHTVFQFVAPRQPLFCAVRGAGEIKGSFDMIKGSRVGGAHGLTLRYDINSSIIKEVLYKSLELEKTPVHLPKWRLTEGVKLYIGDEIFKQFVSERYQELSPGRWGWVKIQARNEVLDTAIYAIACAYMEGLQHWGEDDWGEYEKSLFQPS